MKSIYKLLFEADEDLAVDYVIEDESGVANAKLSADSVDYQIDQFLIKYDRRAVEDGKEAEEAGLYESLSEMSLAYLLSEQEDPFADEDDAGGDDEEDPFADEGGEDTAGGEDEAEAQDAESEVITNAEIEATEPADIPQPPMNIDTFVTELNRLLAMPQNVLSLRTVIINRAKNYLLKNYDKQHVLAFEETMNEGPYKIERYPRQEDEVDGDTPLAVGAYAGGTGGLGGGG